MLPDLGPHAALIAASYLVTFLVIGGLAVWSALDERRQARLLAGLEARGARRRQGGGR